ncbi:MAG TPA: hypothetical protein PLD62_07315 [Candidatus Cloacimonadota bacterium]|nr:hypothetical protein [Candidatus Cloacimonadota bacterium]
MVFLRFLLFIFWNMLPGYLSVFLLKQLLFFPEKEKYFGNGKKIPLTPGFAFKVKNYLIQKITHLVHDYLDDTKNSESDSRISKWETQAFNRAWEKCDYIERIKFLPHKWRESIRFFLASVFYQLVKQFLRSFVPYLMDHFEVEKYIELLDKTIDMKVIKDYFIRYVYRYLLYAVLAIGFIVGLWNAVFYLIAR